MANISSYNQLSSWNENDDLLFVQQSDAPKKAHPSQVKQYVEAGDFEATGEIKDGHGNILKDMAKSTDLESIKVAEISATMSVLTADAKAIGGYRSVSSTSKVLRTFTGYPTGKTVIAEQLYAFGENAAIAAVVNVISGVVYLNAATSGDYTVRGYVLYKD